MSISEFEIKIGFGISWMQPIGKIARYVTNVESGVVYTRDYKYTKTGLIRKTNLVSETKLEDFKRQVYDYISEYDAIIEKPLKNLQHVVANH